MVNVNVLSIVGSKAIENKVLVDPVPVKPFDIVLPTVVPTKFGLLKCKVLNILLNVVLVVSTCPTVVPLILTLNVLLSAVPLLNTVVNMSNDPLAPIEFAGIVPVNTVVSVVFPVWDTFTLLCRTALTGFSASTAAVKSVTFDAVCVWEVAALPSNAACCAVDTGLDASAVLSTDPKPTIDLVIPDTVPVNVGLAMLAFRSNAVCCAVDNGFAASDVLLTFPSPTIDAVIPETVPVKVGEANGAFNANASNTAFPDTAFVDPSTIVESTVPPSV